MLQLRALRAYLLGLEDLTLRRQVLEKLMPSLSDYSAEELQL